MVTSFVYYAQDGPQGPIKIGCSTRPILRLATLQSGNARQLRLLAVEPGDKVLEGQRHALFARYHLRGEWFSPGVPLMKHVAALEKAYKLPDESPEEILEVAALLEAQAASFRAQAAMAQLQRAKTAPPKSRAPLKPMFGSTRKRRD